MAAIGAPCDDAAAEAAGRHLEVVPCSSDCSEKPPACICAAALSDATSGCMAIVAMGVMMLRMMAGVISASVPPCAVVRPCRSRRDE